MRLNENQILAVTWFDAAYTFEDRIPEDLPSPRVTFGVRIREDHLALFIATNIATGTGTFSPVDGFIIPQNAIISQQITGSYASNPNTSFVA